MQQACSDWSKFAARVFLMFFSNFRGQQTRYKIMQFFCFSIVSVKLLCFLSLSTPIPYVNFAFFVFCFPLGPFSGKDLWQSLKRGTAQEVCFLLTVLNLFTIISVCTVFFLPLYRMIYVMTDLRKLLSLSSFSVYR